MKSFFSIIFLLFLVMKVNAQCGNTHHWETALYDISTWRYTIPTAPISNWYYAGFNDQSWSQGPGGFGFGDNDDNTVLPVGNTVCYIRKTFTVTNPNVITEAILNIDYDDAFIAYLNGVEIARSIGLQGQNVQYNSLSSVSHEANMYSGGLPETFVIPTALLPNLIYQGNNVLAIAVYNVDSFSSDLTVRPFLHFGISNAQTYFGSNPSWFNINANTNASHLPIMNILTGGQNIVDDPRITADLRIIDNPSNPQNCLYDTNYYFKGKITIERRGSTSQWFAKTPYGFTTVDQLGADSNVKWWHYGMEHDWVLLNTYNDKTFMRDQLAYDLANEMGWYASKTKHVVVYINNVYQGIYLLLEKIKRDKSRVDINKVTPTDNTFPSVTGGYIFKLDKPTGNSGSGFQASLTGINYQFHYPKYNVITQQQATYLKSSVDSFESSLSIPQFNHPDNGYRKLSNVYSFIDDFLLLELSNNVDGYRLSTFLYKDNLHDCGRIVKGPIWDFNLSFGNADYCNGGYAGWQISDGCGSGTSEYTKKMLTDPWFMQITKCRWKELRNGIFHKDSLFARIDAKANYLRPEVSKDSALYQTIGNYIWPNGWVASTWQGEIDSMKLWISKRLAWIDSAIGATQATCTYTINNGIVIDEVNYNSSSAADAGDWLELWNTTANTIDLSNAVIMNPMNKTKYCVLPRGLKIPAAGRLVICADTTKFKAIHPNVTNYYGPLCFNLSADGQMIRLVDSNNLIMSEFHYQPSWVGTANGLGATLQLINPTLDPKIGASWMRGCDGGTPGMPKSPTCYPVSIETEGMATFSIYPNPSNEYVYLENLPPASSQYEIYNSIGQIVSKGMVTTTIDIQKLHSGVYSISILDQEHRVLGTKKLIKVNK